MHFLVHSGLQHKNLVQMLGVTTNPMRFVLEFVREGDLLDLLFPIDEQNVLFKTRRYLPRSQLPCFYYRLRIALDIATAFQYLHGSSPPIVHRDLHCGNVLVCERELYDT